MSSTENHSTGRLKDTAKAECEGIGQLVVRIEGQFVIVALHIGKRERRLPWARLAVVIRSFEGKKHAVIGDVPLHAHSTLDVRIAAYVNSGEENVHAYTPVFKTNTIALWWSFDNRQSSLPYTVPS